MNRSAAHAPSAPHRGWRGTLAQRALIIAAAAFIAGALASPVRRALVARESSARIARVDGAIDRAVDWLDRPKDALSTALVWLMIEAQHRAPRPSLRALADRTRRTSVRDPIGGLIGRPAAPLDDELAGPDAELEELVSDVGACAASASLSPGVVAFLDEAHEGYLRSHQFLFAHWAEQLGCRMPDGWTARRAALLDGVERELRADSTWSDLRVERLAVLELAGRGAAVPEVEIERLLAAQDPDGRWESPSPFSTVSFHGREIRFPLTAMHMTPLALLVLAGARERLAESLRPSRGGRTRAVGTRARAGDPR